MKLFLAILAVAMVGCASHKGYIPADQSAAPAMDRVCVTTAKDGKYDGEPYPGSGAELSGRILAVLRESKLGHSTLVPEADDEGVKQCAAKGFEYMLEPRALHWEDRATQWSGLPDRISIDLTLSSVQPYKNIRHATFSAKSTWFTFVNNPPEDMLDENFANFVLDVVGLPPVKPVKK
jgi:hypothetical protein